MRGVMYAPTIATQERDYSGLRYGRITPTDVDGLLDFQDKVWVVFELKRAGNNMPYGQRLALERLVDDLAGQKPAVGFVAEHNGAGVIDAALAVVVKMRWKGQWRDDNRGLTLAESINIFLRHNGIWESSDFRYGV